MKNFLRLEFSNRQGIYTVDNYDLKQAVRNLIQSEYGSLTTQRHPTPTNDSLLWRQLERLGLEDYDVRHGFSDETQFRAWFPSDEMLEKFSDLGVQIVLYKVPNLIKGNAQSVIPGTDFNDGTIKEVFRMSLREYLERKNKGELTIKNSVVE